jgi:hypothetical protein
VQGGGVGLVKHHGAGHKEYKLLAEVAVADAGGQLSNKTPALLQSAPSLCTVIKAYCDLFFSKNNRLCFSGSGNYVLQKYGDAL